MAKSASKSGSSAKKSAKSGAKKPAKKIIKVKKAKPVKTVAAKPAAPVKPATAKSKSKSMGARLVEHHRPEKFNGKHISIERGKSRAELLAEPEFIAPIAPPVATNLKPRKNQAGFGSRDLEHFRDQLLEKRREIVGDMSSMEREALRTGSGSNLSTLPIHMADMGTDNYEQEFTLGLVEKDRNLLREINNALAKIQNGSFGICEGTGKPIAKARLDVQPWARFSIEYARKIEKSGMGVR